MNETKRLVLLACGSIIALSTASGAVAQTATTPATTTPATPATTTPPPPVGSALSPAITMAPAGVSSSSGIVTRVATPPANISFNTSTFVGPDGTNFLSIPPPSVPSSTAGNPTGTGSTPNTQNLLVNVNGVTHGQDFDLTTQKRVFSNGTTTAPATPTPAITTTPFVQMNGIQNPSVTMELYRPGDSTDLNFSSFGAWDTNTTAFNVTGGLGVIASGQDTPVGAIPTTGTATYNGATTGFVQVGSNTPEMRVRGTASVTANFASGAINTNFNIPNQIAFTGAANLVGGTNTYQGTTSVTSVTNPILPSTLMGNVRGAFYGPAAQETAGTWTLGGVGGGGGQVQAIGAFGAKK